MANPATAPDPSWTGSTGSVVDVLSGSLDAVRERGEPLPDIYVCGSPGMVEAVRAAAIRAGLPEDRVFHEQCGAASA